VLRNLSHIIPHSARGSFWLGFGFCLLVCFLIILVLSPWLGISKSFGGSGHDGYLEIAWNLIRGNGFVFEPGGAPVLHRAPFYPLLISPLTLLPEGLQRPGLIVVQSAMVGGIAFLIFRIGEYLFNVSTAGMAVTIFLLNPWVYMNAKNPMTPIVQGFLYILFVFLIGRNVLAVLKGTDSSQDKRKWWNWLVMGGAGAALILTHAAMIFIPFVLLLMALIAGIHRRSRELVTTAIMSGVVMVLLVTPWTYRNWLVYERFLPVATNFGRNYAISVSHWDVDDENTRNFNIQYERSDTHFHGLKNPNIDADFNRKAIEHILSHPSGFAKRFLLNAIQYYFPTITYPFRTRKGFSPEGLALTVFHLILWGLAVIAICRERKPQESWSHVGLLLGLIVSYAVWYWPVITYVGHSLYTFGTMPFLSILASRGLVAEQFEVCDRGKVRRPTAE